MVKTRYAFSYKAINHCSRHYPLHADRKEIPFFRGAYCNHAAYRLDCLDMVIFRQSRGLQSNHRLHKRGIVGNLSEYPLLFRCVSVFQQTSLASGCPFIEFWSLVDRSFHPSMAFEVMPNSILCGKAS